MAVSFVLLLLFVFNGADGSHIVGGRDAPSHSRPYMASLQVGGQHICGGALVREDFVVTAAHCRLNNRARLTEEVQLIPLKADRVTARSRCLTAGWGTIDDNNTLPRRLQEVNVTILSTQACRRRWGQASITRAMICGRGGRAFQGFCSGDSGGPLVCDGATAGVVSFSGRRCGDPRTPDVYTRISSFREWITTVINNS
uniref:Serine protease 57-like n=1 Tax=Acanthochromis polyacanthus TaxID=80966 RepID=A0A3Q1GW81_9TELE